MKKQTKRKGFTLVEMLVVIAIIALLVSIIIPVVGKSTVKSAAATNAANLRSIEGKISTMRVENPQIFQSVVEKAPSTILSILLDPNLSWESRLGMAISLGIDIFELGDGVIIDSPESWLASGKFGSEYVNYHVYHDTADENDVITISVVPSVAVHNVPKSKECNAGDMKMPKDIPMTIYVSDIAVLATYEYGGNSYTKDDFAKVADTGEFEGTGSGGMTSGGATCTMGTHEFVNCVCIHCKATNHKDNYPNKDHVCDNGCGKSDMGTHSEEQYLGKKEGKHAHGCTYCGVVAGNCDKVQKVNNQHGCSTCTWVENCEDDNDKGHDCDGCSRPDVSDCYDRGYNQGDSTNHYCKECDGSPETHSESTNIPGVIYCSKCGKNLGGCVTPDTLVTMADGSLKRIDEVTYSDYLLVWDFFKGEYAVVPAAIIFDHGYDNNTVIALNFSDGTTVKVVNLHQFYDADLNKFVTIDAASVAQYVGHSFAKQGGKTVELVGYTVSQEYVEAFGIISAVHYNIFVEGMFSTDFMAEDYDLFNYFAFGDDMKFDQAQMKSDIEQYGLYTYEEFADYLTYEQFIGFNVPYMKVAVGKGNYTHEGILNLISEYLGQ